MAVEVQRDILEKLGMDFINFGVIGNLFRHQGPEVEFFKNEIENKGLTDFSVSIVSGCSDDKKREIVQNLIKTWNITDEETDEDKFTKITFDGNGKSVTEGNFLNNLDKDIEEFRPKVTRITEL